MVKGKVFERHVAILFRKYYPESRRGLQYQSGTYVPDVVNCGEWYIECKTGKSVLTVNQGKNKIGRYKPDNPFHMKVLYEYYLNRMILWKGKENKVLIVWKLNYQPIMTMIIEEEKLITRTFKEFEMLYLQNNSTAAGNSA